MLETLFFVLISNGCQNTLKKKTVAKISLLLFKEMFYFYLKTCNGYLGLDILTIQVSHNNITSIMQIDHIISFLLFPQLPGIDDILP